MMLAYVDDILLTSSNAKFLDKSILTLHKKFALKFQGDVHYFLGLEIYRTPSILQLNQNKYVKDLLQKFGLEASNPIKTLMKSGDVIYELKGTILNDLSTYKSLIGASQYYGLTCLDIAFSINKLCQFLHASIEVHQITAKRIMIFLKETITYGLTLHKSHSFDLVDTVIQIGLVASMIEEELEAFLFPQKIY